MSDEVKEFEIKIDDTRDLCRSLKVLKNLKTTLRLFVCKNEKNNGLVLENLSKDFSYYFRSNVEIKPDLIHFNKKVDSVYVGIIDICIMQVIISHSGSKQGIKLYRYINNPTILFIEDLDNRVSSQVSTVEVDLSGSTVLSKLQQLKFDYIISIRLIDLLQILSIATNKQINGKLVNIVLQKQEGVDGLITSFKIQGNKKCIIKKTFGCFNPTLKSKPTIEFSSQFSVYRLYKFLKSLDNTSSFVVLKMSKETPLLVMSKCTYSESMVSMLIPKDTEKNEKGVQRRLAEA